MKANDSLHDATERLEASRLRMQAWLASTRRGYRAEHRTGESKAASTADDSPLAGALPMAIDLAKMAGDEALRPTAQRHPVGLVTTAAVAGAVVMWVRPWRLVLGSALFAGVASQLSARLIAHIPIASLFSAVGTLIAKPRARPEEPAPPNG